MPIQGRQTSQRRASSNEYSHEYSAPESKPDSPNTRNRSEAVTRVDPTPGDTARRGAPAKGHRHWPHVSSDEASTALRALPVAQTALRALPCPNEAHNKGVHRSRSPTARDQRTPLYKPPAYRGRRKAPTALTVVRGLYNIIASRKRPAAVYIVTVMAHTTCDILSWMQVVAQAACQGVEEIKPGSLPTPAVRYRDHESAADWAGTL